MSLSVIVAGIDVGGRTKGFHAVALRDGAYLDKYASRSVAEIAEWCRGRNARFVGVDAPCRWSVTGHARAAERELMTEKIWCFSTPTRKTAETHPKDHFGWMLNGAELFANLQSTHALFTETPGQAAQPLCFETFPNAIACALTDTLLSAKKKRNDRRRLLENIGLNASKLTNIDTIDAALCALTAHYFAGGDFKAYGDDLTGLIVVPGKPTREKLSLIPPE